MCSVRVCFWLYVHASSLTETQFPVSDWPDPKPQDGQARHGAVHQGRVARKVLCATDSRHTATGGPCDDDSGEKGNMERNRQNNGERNRESSRSAIGRVVGRLIGGARHQEGYVVTFRSLAGSVLHCVTPYIMENMIMRRAFCFSA